MKEEDEVQLCESSRGRTIAAGATYTLTRIDLEVTAALLAGCLITLLVIVITLVPVIRAFDSCRSDNDQVTKVYFVRHEERRWTRDELCWIEMAARRYPQFNIFMVNVREKDDGSMRDVFIEELFGNDISMKPGHYADSRLRLLDIPNVRNVDVSVAKLFSGSILSKATSNATSEDIELAAKFQVIWDSAGISLEPRNIAQLESVLYFFDDQIDTAATVQIDGDLQAASVPCQSFIGLVIGEMARSFADRRTIVERAITNFCPRSSTCAGLRIVEARSTSVTEPTECPIVHSYVDNQ